MIYRSILASLLCVVAFSPTARAEEQAETLEQLRQRYQEARDTAAKTENPELGSEGFRDKLKVWAEAARATGGLVWQAGASSATNKRKLQRAVYEEWARPLRIDHLPRCR